MMKKFEKPMLTLVNMPAAMAAEASVMTIR